MSGMAFVMSKTSNNYFDIMKMPYIVYKSIFKNLYIQEMSKNPEWYEAYQKWKLKQNYSSVKESNPKQKCDVKGLQTLIATL